jgi:uncharacterized protein with GYD domain
MTPEGAASEKQGAKRDAAVAARRERTGYVFAALVQEARSSDVVTNPGGADLKPLADAVLALAKAFFAKNRDTRKVKQAVAILKARVRAMLKTYNGR